MDENEQSKSIDIAPSKKLEPKTLMVLVGIVLALVLLVALNMK